MENNENYEAQFYLTDRELKISGPVDFVKDQMQFTKNIIDLFAERLKQNMLEHNEPKALALKSNEPVGSNINTGEEFVDFEEVRDTEFLNRYSQIIAIDGEKIQILSKIPGNSLGARMVNLILIYLYTKLKAKSIERVSFSELRDICELHGELDSGHFSLYLKKNKKWFLLDGSAKNTSAKITIPGAKEAERLLESMKN